MFVRLCVSECMSAWLHAWMGANFHLLSQKKKQKTQKNIPCWWKMGITVSVCCSVLISGFITAFFLKTEYNCQLLLEMTQRE